MRQVLGVLLALIFLATAIVSVVFFHDAFSATSNAREFFDGIAGLICVMVAAPCAAALFISLGQDEIINELELARRERAAHAKPTESV